MDESASKINLFTTRVRQLILRCHKLESDNEELRSQIGERDEDISSLKEQLTATEAELQRLKVARLMQVADADVEAARKRIASLIRHVNKCITLLSEK